MQELKNNHSKYILALDLGTTGNRAFVFDIKANIIGQAYKELTQYYPQRGWLEHNPQEIWEDTCWVMENAINNAQITPDKIAAIGLRVKNGTCYHGVSFNIAMDLAPFARINPCGFVDLAVTDCQQLGIMGKNHRETPP